MRQSISISMPEQLVKRLRAQSDLNWSAICVLALEEALGDKNDPNLTILALTKRVVELERVIDKIHKILTIEASRRKK